MSEKLKSNDGYIKFDEGKLFLGHDAPQYK